MADLLLTLPIHEKEAIGPGVFKDAQGDVLSLPLPDGYKVAYTTDNTAVATVDPNPDANWDVFVHAVAPGTATITGTLTAPDNTVLDTHTWGVTVVPGTPATFTPAESAPIAE